MKWASVTIWWVELYHINRTMVLCSVICFNNAAVSLLERLKQLNEVIVNKYVKC